LRRSPARVVFILLALVVGQAAHSVEEYRGRLYDVFAPARFVSGLISPDRERGFIVFNVALVAFGFWCVLFPVRRQWRSGVTFMWLWVAIEVLNGIGHPAWSLMRGGYTPGVATAPILLALALWLARELNRQSAAA
jgi:hypothetical protein